MSSRDERDRTERDAVSSQSVTEAERDGGDRVSGDPGNGDPGNGNHLDRLVRAGARQVWRLIVLIVGGTVLLIGLAMMILPGPALVVLPLGLAILAVEFTWARRLLRRVRAHAEELRGRYQDWRDRE